MYLGLDCSTFAVHAAIVDDEETLISLNKSSSKKKKFEERFPEIMVDFSEYLTKIKVTNAIIEAAIYIQNPKTTIAIAHVVGAVWFVLIKAGIDTAIVQNKEWKRDILKGNVSKEEIKKFAIEKWGDIFPEQDYADAACIALLAQRSR